jgi:hypothetical protein
MTSSTMISISNAASTPPTMPPISAPLFDDILPAAVDVVVLVTSVRTTAVNRNKNLVSITIA